jgi:selenocysteine lyase/cysteine desulfurase
VPDTLADLRSAFPIAEFWVYLNHAAVSPLPSPVVDAVAEFTHDAARHGSTGFAGWLARRERARERAAALLGARPFEIALTTSTSMGLLTVAEGLRLDPGDQIVIVEDDFPANQIPWLRQRRRGAEVVMVPRDEGRVTVDAVMACVTQRTRLVAVPWVLYDNGFRLDVEALGAALADHPALYCVDAIQGLGAFPLDVEAARIDFLSADSHKWMLGIEGIGIFYCRQARLELLDSPFTSWWSLAEPFAPFHADNPLHADARRFEFATLPTVGAFALDAALGLLLNGEVGQRSERIMQLTGRLAEGLAERDWTLHTPMDDPAERSGIISASHPSLDAEEVVARLTERKISVATRGAGVRFSPHAWNVMDEIEHTLTELP